MAFTITDNRGMSGFPSGYIQAWQNYSPFPQQRVGGGKSPNQNAAENAAYAQMMSLVGGAPAGRQAPAGPLGKPRGGGYAPGTILPPKQGGNSGRTGGGVPTGGTPGIPPATTNPQTPIQPSPLVGLAQLSPGITSGQLSDNAIAQALAALTGGGTGAFSGGSFADLLGQMTNRNQTELQRAAAEQQADMQHAFEVARANQGIQQGTLASDINRQNVMHQVNMRNDVLGLLGQLMGGLI